MFIFNKDLFFIGWRLIENETCSSSFRLVEFLGQCLVQYETIFPVGKWKLPYKMSCRDQRFGCCLSDPRKTFDQEIGFLKRLSSGEKVIPFSRSELFAYNSQLKIVIPLDSSQDLKLNNYNYSLKWRIHKLDFPSNCGNEDEKFFSCKEAFLYFLIKNYKNDS
jgi:hypothetical protein